MKDKLSLVFGVIFLVSLMFIAYIVGKFLFQNLRNVDPNILVAILGAAGTLMTFILTRHYEKKKLIEQQIREQKLPAYEEFLDFLFNIFIRAKHGEPLSGAELDKLFYSLNKKSILWLSSSSLRAYRNFRKISLQVNAEDLSADNKKKYSYIVINSLEQVLVEFRKDIGHSDKLEAGDIVSLFINDYDSALAQK